MQFIFHYTCSDSEDINLRQFQANQIYHTYEIMFKYSEIYKLKFDPMNLWLKIYIYLCKKWIKIRKKTLKNINWSVLTSTDHLGSILTIAGKTANHWLKTEGGLTLIDYSWFYVPLKNFSLIWRRHHSRWRAAKFRP
jgi:hypothetical protein